AIVTLPFEVTLTDSAPGRPVTVSPGTACSNTSRPDLVGRRITCVRAPIDFFTLENVWAEPPTQSNRFFAAGASTDAGTPSGASMPVKNPADGSSQLRPRCIAGARPVGSIRAGP